MSSNVQHAMQHAPHVIKHVMESPQGKELSRNIAAGATALAVACPPLLPLAAVGAAAAGLWWWISKK